MLLLRMNQHERLQRSFWIAEMEGQTRGSVSNASGALPSKPVLPAFQAADLGLPSRSAVKQRGLAGVLPRCRLPGARRLAAARNLRGRLHVAYPADQRASSAVYHHSCCLPCTQLVRITVLSGSRGQAHRASTVGQSHRSV